MFKAVTSMLKFPKGFKLKAYDLAITMCLVRGMENNIRKEKIKNQVRKMKRKELVFPSYVWEKRRELSIRIFYHCSVVKGSRMRCNYGQISFLHLFLCKVFSSISFQSWEDLETGAP